MKIMSAKRKIVVAFAALLLFAIIVFVLAYLLKKNSERDATFRNDELSFAAIDYETDILADPYYLRYSRNVIYNEYGNAEPLTEDNYRSFGDWAEFFYHYFETVINGDYNTYKTFFTESYLKSHDLPEKFTMQRIYDINVELFSRNTVEYNGATVPSSLYIVSYRIQYNNGTFRGDIISNTVRPLLFSLINDNGTVKIYSITQINYQGAE